MVRLVAALRRCDRVAIGNANTSSWIGRTPSAPVFRQRALLKEANRQFIIGLPGLDHGRPPSSRPPIGRAMRVSGIQKNAISQKIHICLRKLYSFLFAGRRLLRKLFNNSRSALSRRTAYATGT